MNPQIDVLLVEDDDATARVLQRLLEGVGMTVRRAASVATAIPELALNPTLLVLDLMLPDGSGVNILSIVRQEKLKCKVAIVSAAEDPALFTAVTALKPDAVFGKPLDFDDFVDWMSSIFTEDPVAAYKLTA
jgi:DNA-binding response OmpR family regulator